MDDTYIRVIPCHDDTSFNVLGTKYIKESHFLLFSNPEKYGIDVSEPCHYRLDIFEKKQKYETTNFQSLLVLDFDVEGDKREIEESEIDTIISKLVEFTGISRDKMSLNQTGYGFHVYWFFNKYFKISEEPYLKPFAKDLRAKISYNDIKFDIASFNPSKTMRFPGSFYRKRDGENVYERQCKYEIKPIFLNFDAFKNKFQNLYPTENKIIDKKSELKTLHLRKKIDWQAIVGKEGEEWSGCRFIRWSFNSQGEPNYQEWMAQIRLTSRFLPNEEDAYLLSKQFNDQSGKFKEIEFRKKFEQALKKMNPPTCKGIEEVWRFHDKIGAGCIDCPHKSQNMPLLISDYPDKDTGFRRMVLNQKGVLKGCDINYKSFIKYLNNECKVIMEGDESVWAYNEDKNLYEMQTKNTLIKNYSYLLNKPTIKEYKEFEYIFPKFTKSFNILHEYKKSSDYVFFKNGTFDLKTGKLHSRDYLDVVNTYCMRGNYDPNATAPRFNDLIEFALDKVQKDFFLKFLATALFSDEKFQDTMVLLGSGSNGKSSLMNAMIDLFKGGSIITPLDLSYLIKDKASLSMIKYSKIAYCSDTDPNFLTRAGSSVFKMLTGNEQISYRLPYSKSVSYFKNRSKLIFGLNELPIIKDKSKGLERRFKIVEFNNTFPSNKADPNFRKKIKVEASGIFNILYEYLLKYKEEGFLPLPNLAYKTALEESWIKDDLDDFVNVCFEADKLCEVSNKEIYNLYLKYFAKEGGAEFKRAERRAVLSRVRKVYKNKFVTNKIGRDRTLKGIKFSKYAIYDILEDSDNQEGLEEPKW